MAKTQKENIKLGKEELIKLITKNSANIITLLKQDITTLSLTQLNQLLEISASENSARKLLGNYASRLTKFSLTGLEMLNAGLKQLDLSDKEQEIVNNIFRQTILVGVNAASTKLLEPLIESDGFLYNKILSEQTVTILESTLEYKKSIDQIYPGLSDQIISASIMAITALASAYAPPVGLTIKATGLLTLATEYLKTDNLEKTVKKMQTDLNKISETKYLAEAQELGIKLSKLSEILEVSEESLKKSGINLENIEVITKEVTKHKAAADFLVEVCKYTEKQIPNSSQDVEKLFEKIKQEAISDLKLQGSSKELIADFEKIYTENAIHAEVEIESSLGKNANAFEKITAMQKSAEIMEKSQKKILNTLSTKYPDKKEAIASAINIIDNKIKEEVRGDLSGIAAKMNKDTKAKTLAKEHLGAGLASEITIKRAHVKETSQIKSI